MKIQLGLPDPNDDENRAPPHAVFPQLTLNGHTLLCGTSGSGKSFALSRAFDSLLSRDFFLDPLFEEELEFETKRHLKNCGVLTFEAPVEWVYDDPAKPSAP